MTMRHLQGAERDDPIEFLAFLVWYLFLVMCCLIPTCCAYRRRRVMERRLAEQQASMQQRLQQSNLLFLSNLSQESGPSLERVRTHLITDDLASTTMTLEAHHFVDSNAIPAKAIDGTYEVAEEANEDIESQQQQEHSESDERTGWIRLPYRNTNVVTSSPDDTDTDNDDDVDAEQQLQQPEHHQSRLVSDTCTICLCQYDEGESITWSTRPECVHAFHTQCIISWLAKQDQGPQCPICRQEFCSRSFMPAVRQEDEFLRTISQALLLTQLYGAPRPTTGDLGGIQLVPNVRPEIRSSEEATTTRRNDDEAGDV